MKKFTKILISFLLSGLAVFSVACGGQSGSSQSGSSSGSSGSGNNEQNNTQTSIYQDTEYDFVKNNATDYTVVYPENEYIGTKIQKSVTTIRSLVLEATGASLTVQSDKYYTSTEKIISLGKTKQALANQSYMSKVNGAGLGSSGYLIETIDESIYLCGDTDYGVLYSVYELMSIYFGYEFYADDCYSLNKNVQNCKVKDVDLIDLPDFQERTNSGAEFRDEYRTVAYTKTFNDADGNFFVHNIFMLVPPSKYMEEHPKWFTGTTVNDQFCFLAKGDEKEREALKDALVYEITRRLEMQPNRDWISISQQDGGKWCTCEHCTEYAKEYGARTGPWITVAGLINMVAKEIKVWNETTCPERDITIFMWHYGKVGIAPVKTDENDKPLTDENGEYIPLFEDLMLEDNVGVYFCYRFTDAASVADEIIPTGSNEIFFEHINRCRANMKNPQFYFWLYTAEFNDYIAPFEVASLFPKQYKTIKQVGGIGCFDQGVYNVENGSDWYNLENYLSSKLLWDCTLDLATLEKNFINEYFGEASQVMYEFYREYKSHMAYLKAQGLTGKNAKNAECWPFKTVQRFLGFIDKAYEAIAPLKVSDPVRYEKLYNRILRESVTYKHLQLQIYPMYFSVNELENMKREFLAICQQTGVNYYNEWNKVEALYVV